MIAPIPTMSPLSPAPNRQTSSRTQFTIDVDRRLSEENRLTVEANALAEWMNAVGLGIEQAYQAVELDTQAAKDAAILAGQHREASEAAAQASAASAGTADDRAQAAVDAAGAAGTSRDQAQTLRNQAGEFRDEAQTFRDQAQALRDETEAIKIGEAINDTSLRSDQVRSALNDSIGNFRNVPMAASGSIAALDFAQITAAGAAVTVTLPAAPLEGQLVMVGNLTARRDHRIAVGAAKVKGTDPAGYLLINKPMTTVRLKYINAAYGWDIY